MIRLIPLSFFERWWFVFVMLGIGVLAMLLITIIYYLTGKGEDNDR